MLKFYYQGTIFNQVTEEQFNTRRILTGGKPQVIRLSEYAIYYFIA